MGMTVKQSQRHRYFNLCQAYNKAVAGLPESDDEDIDAALFIGVSVALHAAKGWEHIPKYMTRPAWIRRCGLPNQ